jgi:hypothetical protein
MERKQYLEDNTSRKNGFQQHPSVLLNNLYKEKNHQGADPKTATILFVGRDPNWAIDVENMSMFHFVSDYLNDGVHFWKTHNIHHPFLLPSYKGDGKRYHTIFSKLKLDSKHSNQISFIELIGFPTTGMAKKDNKSFQGFLISDLNLDHLIHLDNLINDLNKAFFVAWGLIDDFQFIYKKTGLFQKFANLDKRDMDINDLNEFENVFLHKHFSDSISNATINKISEKANLFLNKSL